MIQVILGTRPDRQGDVRHSKDEVALVLLVVAYIAMIFGMVNPPELRVKVEPHQVKM